MELVIKMVEQAYDELDGSKEYIKCATKYKSEYPEIAQVYYEMSLTEMEHMAKIHDMIDRLINNMRAKGIEIDEKMMAIYEYEHDKAIEKATKIRVMQEMYKR